MIGYVCKYTPIEIFETLGEKVMRIEPKTSHFDNADTLMHPNMCSYSKAVLEEALASDYESIILVTCCDSVRRLHDTLKKQFPSKFIYLLDIPRKNTPLSRLLFKAEIEKMIKSYEVFSAKTFEPLLLKNLLDKQLEVPLPQPTSGVNVGIIGARCSQSIIDLIKDTSANVLFNLTCTALNRHYQIGTKDPLLDYSYALLNQFPCMRMEESIQRQDFLDTYKDKLDGIIYHTIKFCDNYSYEYAKLKNSTSLPILKIETDYSSQCEGQIKTRLEAFLESLFQTKNININNVATKEVISFYRTSFVLGIDSGSTSTNAVILDQNKKLIAFSVVRTGAKSGDSAKRAFEEVLHKAHLKRGNLALIVATGYGRVSIPFADKNVTEISCHGKGAHYLNPKIRTIIDIGGQDSKAIKLNELGEVIDFVMNDKCAAGTGRFLEMMARTLEIDIKEMGSESLKSKEDITISSMCSVFAESEVISLIAENKEKCDIIHGIHKAIANKSSSLLGKIGKQGDFMMTGGVAKNIGVVRAIEEKLGVKLFISNEPEIVGALGAALFALEELAKTNIV